MRPTDVLADLLVMASEAGPERLVETDRLLRELVGDHVVIGAHEVWTDRLREGVISGEDHAVIPPGHGHGHDVPSPDVFDLTRRLRATRPGRGGRW